MPSLGVVANHVWQSTLVAAAIWGMAHWLRHDAARVRHLLWVVASATFLLPFALLVQLAEVIEWPPAPVNEEWSRAGQALGAPFTAESLAARATGVAPTDMSIALVAALWAGGALLSAARWLFWRWHARRLVTRAQPVDIGVAVETRVGAHDAVPGVFGTFRPVLLLPAGLTERLTGAELDAVVAHELCHVRRHDNLTLAMHTVVETIFWFHPAVWWIGRRLLDEQERACDEDVLAGGARPRDTVTQRYDFTLADRLRVSWNSDNPPPGWQIDVLVLERGR